MSSVKVPSVNSPVAEESMIASKLTILKQHPYVTGAIIIIVCCLIYYFYFYGGGIEGLKKKKTPKKKKAKDSDDEDEDNEKAEGEEIDTLIKGINKKQKSDDDE